MAQPKGVLCPLRRVDFRLPAVRVLRKRDRSVPMMDNWLKDGWLKGKYYLGLLLARGLAVLLVRAEEHQDWSTAQASLVIILSLLALMAWVWWKESHPACQLPVEAKTYDRATNKALLCVAIGFAALILNTNRKDHWEHGGCSSGNRVWGPGRGCFFHRGSTVRLPIRASPGRLFSGPFVELNLAASHQSRGNCGLVDEAISGCRSCRVDPFARAH